MARKLSIDNPISYRDPLDPKAPEEQITVGEAVIRSVRLGVPRYIAAQASGIDPATLRRWAAAAAEVEDLPESKLTANQRTLRTFCAELEKADAEAVTYAVAMVRRAMPDSWQAAMTWAERRFPRDFSRRIEVDHDPTERQAAPIDAPTTAQVEEAFDAAHVPEGIDPASILPAVGESEAA